MASMFGASNRFHEVMAGSRPLTLPMIRRINARMGIPAEVLIQEAAPARRKPAKRAKAAPRKVAKGKVRSAAMSRHP
jgi:HTH-type transcriptional regulator/antitoxin HigA